MNKREDVKLDAYEQEIADTINAAPAYSPEIQAQLGEALMLGAQAHLKKDKRVTVKIRHADFENIVELAEEEGLTYQTYITSILHKLSARRLKAV